MPLRQIADVDKKSSDGCKLGNEAEPLRTESDAQVGRHQLQISIMQPARDVQLPTTGF